MWTHALARRLRGGSVAAAVGCRGAEVRSLQALSLLNHADSASRTQRGAASAVVVGSPPHLLPVVLTGSPLPFTTVTQPMLGADSGRRAHRGAVRSVHTHARVAAQAPTQASDRSQTDTHSDDSKEGNKEDNNNEKADDSNAGGDAGEGEEETNYYAVAAAVAAVLAGLGYWLVDELRDDIDMREEWTEQFPLVMSSIRAVLTIDPPADPEPVIRWEEEGEGASGGGITTLLVSSKGRLFRAQVSATEPFNMLRARFEAAKTSLQGSGLEAVDEEGAPGDDEHVLDIAFLADDGSIPRGLREPTEEELVDAIASLEKQEQWALANKKKQWWFTEERSVFRDYATMMRGQREDAENRLARIRSERGAKQAQLEHLQDARLVTAADEAGHDASLEDDAAADGVMTAN